MADQVVWEEEDQVGSEEADSVVWEEAHWEEADQEEWVGSLEVDLHSQGVVAAWEEVLEESVVVDLEEQAVALSEEDEEDSAGKRRVPTKTQVV